MRQLTSWRRRTEQAGLSKLPMRQLTTADWEHRTGYVSKLPMRQLTRRFNRSCWNSISKLPMRQLTRRSAHRKYCRLSKLPMRQLTQECKVVPDRRISKLPMRQLTVIFCANSLILLELTPSNTYLTKILCTCQSPWFTRHSGIRQKLWSKVGNRWSPAKSIGREAFTRVLYRFLLLDE